MNNQPHRHYDPVREEYRQSAVIAFTCGAIIGLLTGVIGTLGILSAMGMI